MFLRERKPIEFQKDEANHVFQELNLLAKHAKNLQKCAKKTQKKNTEAKSLEVVFKTCVLPCSAV